MNDKYRYSATEILDSRSETAPYCNLLDGKDRWIEALQEYFDIYSSDLLVLDRIEVQPEHRGQGYDLPATCGLIDAFGPDCGLVAMKPFPLQSENKVNEGNLAEFKAAQKKLGQYWSRVGFQPVPGSPELLALSTAYKQPSFAQMLRKGKTVRGKRSTENGTVTIH